MREYNERRIKFFCVTVWKKKLSLNLLKAALVLYASYIVTECNAYLSFSQLNDFASDRRKYSTDYFGSDSEELQFYSEAIIDRSNEN